MAEINNPKAFPSKKFDRYESQRMGGTYYSNHESGMSLRDYFAAKAMEGLVSSFKGDVSANFDIISIVSYKMADAMLKQRQE